MPAVRVGIVSWNTAERLQACLQALPAALEGLDAEIVVVDNASRDDSVAVAERSGARVLRNVENRGYARAMNRALSGPPTEYLIALNPDTVPAPGSLRALVDHLAAHPDVGLVVPRLMLPDGSVQPSVHRYPSLRLAALNGFVPHSLRTGRVGARWWLDGANQAPYAQVTDIDWAIGAVHVIRTAALDGHPPYDERWFMYVEDLDLCARAAIVGMARRPRRLGQRRSRRQCGR